MRQAVSIVAMLLACLATLPLHAQDTTAMSHPVYELRQYTLHPGQRETLIDLFEQQFIEPQEAEGMQVIAHFRDHDAPDRFVWFRGFADMDARGRALPAFYQHGAAWKTHRTAANTTMRDSDNVLLLRQAWPGSGFAPPAAPRPAVGARENGTALVVVTTYALVNPVDAAFVAFFRDTLAPRAQAAGARLLASFVTEESANNFAPLPVRPEHVLVWVAAFENADAHARYRAAILADPRWRDEVAPVLAQRLVWPADERRLQPAARSAIR